MTSWRAAPGPGEPGERRECPGTAATPPPRRRNGHPAALLPDREQRAHHHAGVDRHLLHRVDERRGRASGTAPVLGDMLVALVLVTASAETISQSAGTGSWTIPASNSNTYAEAFTSALAYRVYMSGDTAPTWTGPRPRRMPTSWWRWLPIPAGALSFDAEATVKVDTTTATTHQANTATAAYASDLSLVLTACGTAPPALTPSPSARTRRPAGRRPGSAGTPGRLPTTRTRSARITRLPWAPGLSLPGRRRSTSRLPRTPTSCWSRKPCPRR